MKKIITAIAMCTFLVGVSEGNNEKAGSREQSASGLFTATVAGNQCKVEVRCAHFDQDYFQFRSDKSDESDTNGDRMVVSGMQTNGKFALTIIDNGRTFSVDNLSEFSKGDNTAEGSGKLFEEGTADAHDVRFFVSC